MMARDGIEPRPPAFSGKTQQSLTGKRGRVVQSEPEPEGKVRITIRLDQDIVDRFLQTAEALGGETGYQTLISAALREYLDGKAPRFEDTLRRIIREELKSNAA